MSMNIGPWDRLIRLILAVAVAVLLLTKVLQGTLAVMDASGSLRGMSGPGAG